MSKTKASIYRRIVRSLDDVQIIHGGWSMFASVVGIATILPASIAYFRDSLQNISWVELCLYLMFSLAVVAVIHEVVARELYRRKDKRNKDRLSLAKKCIRSYIRGFEVIGEVRQAQRVNIQKAKDKAVEGLRRICANPTIADDLGHRYIKRVPIHHESVPRHDLLQAAIECADFLRKLMNRLKESDLRPEWDGASELD